MRKSVVLAIVFGLTSLSACKREVRLEAQSLFALHQSTESMKRELKLSKAGARAFDNAIDVLIGEATRELIAAQEASGEVPGPQGSPAEAKALAPVHGLTHADVLVAAIEKRKGELQGLVAELDVEEAAAAEQQASLDLIKVVRAKYGMSLATRRSWIDLTVYNATDQRLTELLLDCRLTEPGRPAPREKGTCSVQFAGGIDPGTSRVGQAYVGWETEPRSKRQVEAWPIKAYGAGREVLWEVPSKLNPLHAGRIGDLRTRLTVVENSLRSLQVETPIGL
ncbi:MAG TPA: hypothetical protein VMS86_05765 [Thermoanaerobaculia bacterium]|nr:hypothetical protein [Thermoanaerobaculia bacterium]